MAFWNVAGIMNKGVKFWGEIKQWKIVVMVEAWVDEKKWDKVRRILPKGYRWERQLAIKRNRKGRPMGGIIIGVRKDEGMVRVREVEEKGEGVMVIEVEIGKEKWTIVGVYVNGDMKKKMEEMREWLEEQREDKWTVIGGDFNARTGVLGGGKDGRGRRKR